jgi:hypothetical protein
MSIFLIFLASSSPFSGFRRGQKETKNDEIREEEERTKQPRQRSKRSKRRRRKKSANSSSSFPSPVLLFSSSQSRRRRPVRHVSFSSLFLQIFSPVYVTHKVCFVLNPKP